MPVRLTTEEFIRRAKKVHGDKYDYSKVKYFGARAKVCIVCPEHGEFWQAPFGHLNGQACPRCSNVAKYVTEQYIERANKIHNNKYNYSKTKYINSRTKICIICPEHGEFWQSPRLHLKGTGCPKCGIETVTSKKRDTREQFISKARKIHGDKYDYSKVEYTNNHTKVCIICSVHGEFWQKPNDHLTGYGCPQCGTESMRNKLTMTFETFVKLAREKHCDKYDYIGEYKGCDTPMLMRCPKHGEFYQTPHNHIQGCGCPVCARNSSQNENEIYHFVKDTLHYHNTRNRNREIIPPFELDIYIPNYNLAIEYNGVIWHSEKYGMNKDYHINKLLKCNEKGINLIQIFEDEYLEHKDIICEKLRHLLRREEHKEKIYARKCQVNEVSKEVAKEFLNKNHIQGFSSATVYLGCFYNETLVSVMAFKRERNASDKWELTRCACDIHKRCIGVPSKLFTFFIRNYNPSEIKSFADRRWTTDKNNNLYTKLGFNLDGIVKPDYKYTIGNKRINKFNFRKQTLIRKYPKHNFNVYMTKSEMIEKLGAYKIWDCGLFKYVWKKNQIF